MTAGVTVFTSLSDTSLGVGLLGYTRQGVVLTQNRDHRFPGAERGNESGPEFRQRPALSVNPEFSSESASSLDDWNSW